MSSNALIYTKSCMFSLYGRWALPFPSPDSMTQHVHPLSEQGLTQLWRQQERIKCNTAAMPTPWDGRGNTDSTCVFSRQLLTWDKQGEISLFNGGDDTHLSKNIFFKIQLPPTILCPAGWEYPWGWLGSRRPSIPISPGFPKCPHLLWGAALSYSVCSSRGTGCNLGESAPSKFSVKLC